MAENIERKKSETAVREERIVEFWKENKIFDKSLKQTEKGKEFVFYDGPVTSNSKPVLHTMVPFSFKDIIPRYKTMQGFQVHRKAGWDTHGLPVEIEVEKRLGIKHKSEVFEYLNEFLNGIADKYYEEGNVEKIHEELLQGLLVDFKIDPETFLKLGKDGVKEKIIEEIF